MQTLYLFAHAGEEHATEAETAAHSSSSTTIILISAAALILIALAIKILSNNKDTKSKPDSDTK